MCLNLITIPNKVKSKYGGLQFIKVPCRNCPECSAMAQADYALRTTALLNSLPDNYSFFFCTLTFNNDNLPRTNVYKLTENGYEVVSTNVPTFNHALYKTFRKSFQQYWMDNFGQKAFIITSSEYGDEKHRPHYHCGIFVPVKIDWLHFKEIIERFWHYGFTKNIGKSTRDGETFDRSVKNCIKYITKYICKYNSWRPFYLKSKVYCTDFPPYEIKPKVFVSNDFGSSLEHVLTDSNYIHNSVFMQLKDDITDKGKNYQLSYYYRRRFFVSTVIDSKEKTYTPACDTPYSDKLPKRTRYEIKTHSVRSPLYQKVLYSNFIKRLSNDVDKFNWALDNNDSFKNYSYYLSIQVDPNSCFKHIKPINKQKFIDQMSIIYRETHSSLSPVPLSLSQAIPYINRIEKVYKRMFRRLNCSPGKFYYIYQEKVAFARDHGLPWIDLPSTDFGTLRFAKYSVLPSEFYWLELLNLVTSKWKSFQYELQDKKDKEYLKIHVKPYIDYT